MTAPSKPASSSKEKPGAAEVDTGTLIQALAAGLEEVVSGFEILDRDLSFDEGGRADLVGVDAAGRPVLVLLAGADAERTALEVLDTLSFARRHAALLSRHLGSPRIRPGAVARLILVQTAQDPALLARLATLQGRGLEMFGIRSVSSSSGERSYLVPFVGPTASATALPAKATHETFLEELSAAQRELCGLLTRRMGRLDDELVIDSGPSGILWSFQGEPLAQVEQGEDALLGGVAPDFVSHRITGEMDVERFLEAALARLAGMLSGDQPDNGGARARAGEDALGKEALLTPEEIAAFRD